MPCMIESTNRDDLTVRRVDLDSPEATELVAALNVELTARYPEEGATHFRLDPEEVAAGSGAFLVVSRSGRSIGCGAVRRLDERTGEIKRMFVRPEERGRGIGRVLLTALENEAQKLGLKRLVLETGTRQTEALALYERLGFLPIPPFGEYVGSPLSVCMAKEL
jgi:putative acetyltransferase